MTSAAPSHYPCNEIIYYAKTNNHKKEVLVCLSGLNLTLTYGGINKEKAEIDFLSAPPNATWFKNKSKTGAFSVGLSIKHYHYQYVIYGFTFDDIFRAGMVITKHNKFVANVKLDPRTAINTIDNHLSAIGLTENKQFKP